VCCPTLTNILELRSTIGKMNLWVNTTTSRSMSTSIASTKTTTLETRDKNISIRLRRRRMRKTSSRHDLKFSQTLAILKLLLLLRPRNRSTGKAGSVSRHRLHLLYNCNLITLSSRPLQTCTTTSTPSLQTCCSIKKATPT